MTARILLLAGWLTSLLPAQLALTGSSSIRYGKSRNGFLYTETLADAIFQYGPVDGWLQFEHSDPPELGRSISGLRKIRFDVSSGPITLELGDMYSIWGRGLILNQLDNQEIDRDTGIRGLGFTLRTDRFRWHTLGGETAIWRQSNQVLGFNDRSPNYRTVYRLWGSDLEVPVLSGQIGISYLESREEHPIPYNEVFLPDTIPLNHRLTGIRAGYIWSGGDIFGEYVDKRTTEIRSGSHTQGNGFYGNVNFYVGDWSLTVEYKNYSFVSLSPYGRWDFVNNYGTIMEFQWPPIGVREHSTRLLSRLTHQVDFNDEVGFQVELSGQLTSKMTALIHYARSSRNQRWEMDKNFRWQDPAESILFPLPDPEANPFREIYSEVEGYGFNDKLYWRVGFGLTKDMPALGYNVVTDTSQNLQYELIDAVTIPAKFEYSFPRGWSIELLLETQKLVKGLWFYRREGTNVLVDSLSSFFPENVQINRFFSLTIGKSPRWALALIYDSISIEEYGVFPGETYLNPLEKFLSNYMDMNRSWVSMELLINVTSTQRLTLMYGSQQGGLLCSNGICRFIAPFDDGYKISLTSLF